MKKLFVIAALITLSCGAFAQNVDLRRKIEVTGIAEKEVTPDIIDVTISLKEYMSGKTKVTISQLEQQLEKAVDAAGIAKEDFTVNDLSSWNYATEKKKDPDFLASKQYGIRFHDLNKYNQILSKLDPKGIQSTNISSYDYSKINDLKNELKLKALLSAKEKATFLLNGIGEKLGQPISIIENDNSSFPSPRPVMYMAKSADAGTPESDIDFRKIKLSFTIQAIFEIK
ncbi:SIMPL domain-containing protein [Mucilaginibacter segetis]|uniref:SIMPL domain-containing protein n=1 Tax=Mucilaginibacter segetis TaxID=2793071 RepID=A0A934UL86_9SPHI|nr:SIMPL domain-containing protein [Mucilaginibacter segetis]MBK0378084.1 SIMPL domain-containing protein [Mucilaginibacter segetis]